MARLPDDALVVRGGLNRPEDFAKGSGVTADTDGKLEGISVNAGVGVSLDQLTAPNAKGYPGIPHTTVGQTTVGKIRASGGEVDPTARPHNPHHATMRGLTPEEASRLFCPPVKNPNGKKRG
jgi:hypothetical protein